jgi:hypothetical protein
MTPDELRAKVPESERNFELRLREIKAQEASARVRPVINIRTSIF